MMEIHSLGPYCPVQTEKLTSFPSVLLWVSYLKIFVVVTAEEGLANTCPAKPSFGMTSIIELYSDLVRQVCRFGVGLH